VQNLFLGGRSHAAQATGVVRPQGLARLDDRAEMRWNGLSAVIRYAPQIAAAFAVLVIGWTLYSWAHDRGVEAERAKWERANREAVERFNEALAAQQETMTKLDAELRKARRASTQKREVLNNALVDSDWAGVAVPLGVRAALNRQAMPADP
jgi:transketolase